MTMRSFDSAAYPAANEDQPVESNGNADVVSLIDRQSSFDGNFKSSRDLRIEGQVKGIIDCDGTLFVAQGASVNATVEAENITVLGELEGDITCRGRLQILPTGRVKGKIHTGTLVINEGAFYEGELEMASSASRTTSASRSTRARTASPSPVATSTATVTTPEAEPAPVAEPGGSASTFIRRLGGQETAWDEPTSGPNNQG